MVQEITLSSAGDDMRAITDKPAGAGPFPGVVVTFHKDGIDDFTTWLVEDLAREGFFAIAPDHFHWLPEGVGPDRRREFLTDQKLASDLAVSRSYLECLEEVDGDAIGILGHCMGGRTTMLGAAVDPLYQAACMWYGGSSFKPLGEGPSPFERISGIACPVMGFFGKEDANPSPEDVEKFDAEMTKHGIVHEFHMYDDTGHGFMNPANTKSYVESSAKDSWARAIAFLKRELVVGRAAAE
jgi:carboxymethylenebutenolidase